MAQLVLSVASTAVTAGARAGLGSILARTVATTAANYAAGQVDRLIFGPRRRRVEGPRLESIALQASSEGAGVMRVYGRARIAGQIIWATNFKETTTQTTQSSGGKGGRSSSSETTITEYQYSASFAIGLCEGVIDRIGRVWADGKLLDLSKITTRVYRGGVFQEPDGLIDAVEGGAPAFRDLAYVVFEDMPLKDFGNRIPQLAFEVEKSLAEDDPQALENALTAVTMIPGSGEFVYGATPVTRSGGEGVAIAENRNNNVGASDFLVSLNALLAAAPNVKSVSLIVSWFGDDLRLGACRLRPKVDAPDKETTPFQWKVSGLTRETATLVSSVGGEALYGGTPTDQCVVEAIQNLNARGISVMMHPFILMDIAPGNGLANPYGAGEQPPAPWRGRITAGVNDGTAAAAGDVAAFFGTAQPWHFAFAAGSVGYSGPPEWSFRRLVLHYARLCEAAGGVDAFLLGSELRAITTTRDALGGYPAVAALQALASEVRAILGSGVKISYGADWSEYFGHQPADGSGDRMFHLDPFWADGNVDFIGIDNYMPLADWRDGVGHLDAVAGHGGPRDLEYLKTNIEGGEGYDWFYADDAARASQARTPIVDGAYGEPWVYRYKDLRNWWSNVHHDRPGGVRAATPTAWVPRSKPIYFTEAGCAAVDKGANQPNVFSDAKSSESALPYFSNGARDDLAQRRFLEAIHAYWRDNAANPVSPIYGGRMVEADHVYVYAWDARPFPFFPALREVWGDADNWETGHWLNGRLARAPLADLVQALSPPSLSVDAQGLSGVLTGYVIDRPMSPRAAIDPLADVFQFDAVETGGGLRFQARAAAPIATLGESALVAGDGPSYMIETAQEADLPAAFRLGFIDAGADYSAAVAEVRDPGAARGGGPAISSEIAGVLGPAEATARARSILADAWVMRETAVFSLPPSQAAIEPGDVVDASLGGVQRFYRVLSLRDEGARVVEAARFSPGVYDAPAGSDDMGGAQTLPVYGQPAWALMDLPLFDENADPAAPYFAAYAHPWPGGVALYRVTASGAPLLAATAPAPAVMGRLVGAMAPATSAGRWDYRSIRIRLFNGAFQSRSADEVLSGANLLAVESAGGGYELVQFQNAQLGVDGVWTLSPLLRGQVGGEAEAGAGAGDGARAVLVSAAVVQPALSVELRASPFDWSAGPAEEIALTENFATTSYTLMARGLTPLSPVHLHAAATGDGGRRFGWIRRTRIGGDSWEGEAPIGETVERYEASILDGETVLRSAETSSPTYDYAGAALVADFGSSGPGPGAKFRVRQWSDRVGWGAPAQIALT